MPYIKRALNDSYNKISELERTQKQLKKTIEEIQSKLDAITK
jgi:archaellum component FlaC